MKNGLFEAVIWCAVNFNWMTDSVMWFENLFIKYIWLLWIVTFVIECNVLMLLLLSCLVINSLWIWFLLMWLFKFMRSVLITNVLIGLFINIILSLIINTALMVNCFSIFSLIMFWLIIDLKIHVKFLIT